MRVERIASPARAGAERRPRRGEAGADVVPEAGKAAETARPPVAVAGRETAPSVSARRPRPAAPFIAQLAANRLGVPQTRPRRRASMARTLEGYACAEALDAQPSRGALMRKVI